MLGRKALEERILIVKTYYGSKSNASETSRLLSQLPRPEGAKGVSRQAANGGHFEHLQ
jgi:hypothetical protein